MTVTACLLQLVCFLRALARSLKIRRFIASIALCIPISCRPGYDLEDTPQQLVWFDDSGQEGVGLALLLLLVLTSLLVVRCLVTKSSVQETMLRAKALGINVTSGGKVRKM